MDLKGDFNRFLSRDGTKLDPTRETKESNRFHSDVTVSNSKLKIARSSEVFSKGG